MVNTSYNQLYVTRVHPHILVIMLFYQKLIDNEYKWVLFNDEKVVVCDDANLQDIKNNAYVYVFRKVE